MFSSFCLSLNFFDSLFNSLPAFSSLIFFFIFNSHWVSNLAFMLFFCLPTFCFFCVFFLLSQIRDSMTDTERFSRDCEDYRTAILAFQSLHYGGWYQDPNGPVLSAGLCSGGRQGERDGDRNREDVYACVCERACICVWEWSFWRLHLIALERSLVKWYSTGSCRSFSLFLFLGFSF